MDMLNNHKDLDQKIQFRKILREFIQALVGAVVLMLALYVFGGFYKKTSRKYICQAERVVEYKKKKHFKRRGSYFAGGDLQSNDFAHSYKYSVKLTKDHRYGLNFEIPAADGDEDLWITVWRYNPEGSPKKGKLVCKSGKFYQDTDIPKEIQDSGWQKLFMRAYLPIGSRNEKIEIYCLQEGKDPVYFDDLEIILKRTDK